MQHIPLPGLPGRLLHRSAFGRLGTRAAVSKKQVPPQHMPATWLWYAGEMGTMIGQAHATKRGHGRKRPTAFSGGGDTPTRRASLKLRPLTWMPVSMKLTCGPHDDSNHQPRPHRSERRLNHPKHGRCFQPARPECGEAVGDEQGQDRDLV